MCQLLVASAAIENILLDMARIEKERREMSTTLSDSNSSHLKNSESEKQKKTRVMETTTAINTRMSISFKDVVGNYEAKQALYENVVLPLTISDDAKVKIFSGTINENKSRK